MKAKDENELDRAKYVMSIAAIIMLLVFSALVTMYFLGYRGKHQEWESLGWAGDFFGGVVGTIIAGLTVYLVWRTFKLQKKELAETKNHLQKQQFESTFFNMLSMINTIGNTISYEALTSHIYAVPDVGRHSGNDFFRYFIRRMKASYYKSPQDLRVENQLVQEIHKLEPQNPNFQYDPLGANLNLFDNPLIDRAHITQWASNNEEAYCGLLYSYWFKKLDTQTAHFLRYIYRTMKFAIQSKNETIDEYEYIGLIQAQLSNYQLAVMFYSGVSDISLNKEGKAQFKSWADKYELFQNIEPDYLIEKEHCKFYPATRFKCLDNRLPAEYNWNDGEL